MERMMPEPAVNESEKELIRDHRIIGKSMDLYHIQEEATGSIFWHPKGWRLYRTVENYMRQQLESEGYVEVKTPQLVDRKLWEQSGHWEKFREDMFTVDEPAEEGKEDSTSRTFALKPMNCPCHVQIFKQGIRSYRQLPYRMAEFGSCHRNEPSGSMHGLMRVRAFTQDDAHIFCTKEQIGQETINFIALLSKIYKDFGFEKYSIKFSDRPEVRAGDDETWDMAENALKDACIAAGVEWTLNPGEGAFYGPKLEFVLRDNVGRDWQCGTLQVDMVLPKRLGAEYIDSESKRQTPVMLHRAILGSFERFIGILIEHYAGKFPVWLAPVQIAVMTITSDADNYAIDIAKMLEEDGYHVVLNKANEKIGAKIREHTLQNIPIMIVVGKSEIENNNVMIRFLDGTQQAQPKHNLLNAIKSFDTRP
jgi:threonyl-tRNA synthetase